jgi:Uma2 family endonuclease
VAVFCGKFGPGDRFLEQPKLIVEVLSSSTERIDRTEKARNYRQIADLEEYVLVAQQRHEVTIFRRADDWRPCMETAPEARVRFHSIGLELEMRQIYEGALEETTVV